MAESWSTSRQAITTSTAAFNFTTDRAAVVVAAKRTYLERSGLLSAYQFIAASCWLLCTRIDPDHSDIIIRLEAVLHSESDINCICTQDTNVVYCRTIGVDNNGPVVLEYPKYYQESTVPPDFDVVFRIYSSAGLDWNSFVLTITTTSGVNKSYGQSDINIIALTAEISEIRLTPTDLLILLGDTVNVRVFMKDIYNRELSLNW